MIMTFDDDQEEFIEFFTNTLFTFFLFTFIYSTYKHSMHFFSFLEASISKGASVSLAIKQFARDMLNTFAFVLRFLVLMLRLNIYDLVDDCLDSYYIFIGDFDDDEYFLEFFISSFCVMFFDTDNNDDRSFQLEGEVDFMADFFVLYFAL